MKPACDNSLAMVVSTLGSVDFGHQLYRHLRRDFDIYHCIAFSAEPTRSPRCIMASGEDFENTRLATALCEEYSAGAYASCPVLKNVLEMPFGCNTIRLVVPGEIQDKQFRERFYEQPQVTHEAVLSTRARDRFVFMSIFKGATQRSFTAEELMRLEASGPLLLSLMYKQAELGANRIHAEERESSTQQLAYIFRMQREGQLRRLADVLRGGTHGLSDREAEVCAHIVCGHTTLAISLRLGITLNTVATHRKKAYRKLGICSQTELFAVCLRATNRLI